MNFYKITDPKDKYYTAVVLASSPERAIELLEQEDIAPGDTYIAIIIDISHEQVIAMEDG